MVSNTDLSTHRSSPPTQNGIANMDRELFYTAITLILLTILFHAFGMLVSPEAYARFYKPSASLCVISAGVLPLIFRHFGRYQAAWLSIFVCIIACGNVLSRVEGFGSSYGLCIYLTITFLALITLPKNSWRVITTICLSSMGLSKALSYMASPSQSDIASTLLLELMSEVFVYFAGVFVVWLVHRQLTTQFAQLQHNNATLTALNDDLKRSEEKSRMLKETGLDPFFVIQQNGSILEVNQRACDLFGYSEAEMLKLPVERLAPEGVPITLKRLFEQAKVQGELSPVRVELRKADGSLFDAELYGRLLQLDENPKMYIAARDITRHLEQEQIVREKSELLEMITQNLPVSIAYFDANSALNFHNRAFADAYQPDKSHGPVEVHTLVSESAYEKRAGYIDRAAQGETVTFELDEILPNGDNRTSLKTYVPHIDNGQVVGRVSLGIDITELRETQGSLRANNALLDHVVNNMPARISYITRDGTVQFVNTQLKQHFGVEAHKAIGRSVHDIMPKAYLSNIKPFVQRAFRTGDETIFESKVEHANGKQVVERSYYYPHVVDGEVEGLFVLNMDITEMRQAEVALAQVQKLESLGLLAGGIAHDFNNLLVAILGQSSLALNKIEETHKARRHIVQSVSAANRAAALTQQMLAYSGRGQFSSGLVDMNEIIEGNLKLFSVSIPKNVRLKTDLRPDLPSIDCDPTQMQQLIMNLIINAGQAIGDNQGTITITTSVRQVSAERGEFWEITGDPLIAGNYVSIEVQDDGSGMDKETVNQIFDPFYTTKEEGSGLGLAAALGIIRGHNGGVHLYSEPGRGTVFHLLFPVAETVEQMVIDVPQVSAETPPISKHTVLIIDDELDILDVVDDMLDLHSIKTLSASNGQDGIALYKQHADTISLVLLDLMMPGMSGQDTFFALRKINPNVQVILSSGYNESEATRQFIGRGLVDFIQKPYDFDTLVGRVQAALSDEPAETAPTL